MKFRISTVFIAATALMTALAVVGCHSRTPSGIYADSTGRATLEFKDGKAYLTLGGSTDTDGEAYDVNGDTITIHYPADGMLASFSKLTINSDGSLQSSMGTLTKK